MYLIYIALGIAPSIIWLLFYLRKDSHPESNRMVIKIFLYGMLITIVAAEIEIIIFEILNCGTKVLPELGATMPIAMQNFCGSVFPQIPAFFMLSLQGFVGIAFVEESLKYLVVREKVLKHSEFDEPVDAMLYMIIVALGFAALENILFLLPGKNEMMFSDTMRIIVIRFLGATFLHALCSATVGFFLALSMFHQKNKLKLLASGIIIATLLHGAFNFFIMEIGDGKPYAISALVILLTGLAIFVSFGFKKLKELTSICKYGKLF